jgi:hypothetical protein
MLRDAGTNVNPEDLENITVLKILVTPPYSATAPGT